MLAGRYRLEDRVQATPDGSIWRAVDETLERPVTVRVLRPGHPFAPDVADAARRVVLIDDARLVRVLDVGVADGVVFIVTEFFAGQSLTELLRRAPLPADEVRRVIGEAAQALDQAGRRGLHHLRLRPDDVMIRPDGSIKLLGLAVEAAASGLETDLQARSTRIDTVALGALAYAGLTGRWPLEESSGLDLAPRQDGGPIGVEVLAPDAPADLVELCTQLLGPFDAGPRDPGALAADLAPWGAARPQHEPRSLPLRPQQGSSAGPAVDRPAADVDEFGQYPAGRAAGEPRHPAAVDGYLAPDETGTGLPTLLPFDVESNVASDLGPNAGSNGGQHGGSNGGSNPGQHGPANGREPSAAAPQPTRPRSRARQPAATASAAATQTPQRIPGPAGPHPLTLGDGVRRPQPGRPDHPVAPDDRSGTLLPWPNGWPGTRDPAIEASLGPFPMAPVAETPSRRESRGVIIALVTVLALVLGFAVWSLRDVAPGRTLLNPSPTFPPVLPTSTTATPTGAATATPPARPTAAAAARPVVRAAVSLDPEGDGSEHPELVDRAFDGDRGTFWRTDGYQTADYSGGKRGLGLVLDLGRPATVSRVTVDIAGRGGRLQLRATDDPGRPGRVLVESAVQNQQAVLTLPAGTLVSRYLVVWCTELPRLSGTKFRLDVSEISVR